MDRRQFLRLGLGVTLGGLLATESWRSRRPAPNYKPKTTDFPWPAKGPIVILAPHPDDEVLGAGGLIQEALDRNIPVKVVLITSGDGFRADTEWLSQTRHPDPADYLAVGRRRYEESRAATSYLGLPPENVRLLGLPDGHTGMLWDRPWSITLTDRYTGVRAVPYPAAWRPGAPYSGASEIDLLKSVLAEDPPGLLILPHPNDVHPDHWATTAFATVALAELAVSGAAWAKTCPRLTYLVHWGGWPPPWPRPLGFHPDAPLGLPAGVENDETVWLARHVNPRAVRRKEEAILRYRTQMVLLGPLLESFARPTEPFGRSLEGRVGRWAGRWEDLPVVLHGHPAPRRPGSFPEEIRLGRDDRHLFVAVSWNEAPSPRSRLLLAFTLWSPRQRHHFTVTGGGVRDPAGIATIQQTGERWLVSLPLDLLGGRQEFILNAESFSRRRFTGQTAHRLCLL